VIGTRIWVLDIFSKIGLENILAEPKLSGFSNLPIFFIGNRVLKKQMNSYHSKAKLSRKGKVFELGVIIFENDLHHFFRPHSMWRQ
jgi:hypothetical protein